ncbi:glycosyltransferase [Rheinheimera sp. MMS21-TC3]|uniref:glycosyltransferase n=1 Tax=Rheinheimera sp. MMS21-TC3 TaxID=3072790 RepID=UPI0028C3AD3B|nr:glycosyltransferase [Rheinheimera sp. MMS21-TC3]WNO61675.1 glycosyltransferase [Rheinheimera sp. MMS21-TC3]
MKVAVLTQGKNIPSTRFRVSQYADKFNSKDINLIFYHAKKSAYPPVSKWQRFAWFISEVTHRLGQIRTINNSDIDCVILQRELISTLPTLERFIRKPIIFDVDDAIFLRKKGLAAKTIASLASHITCGNSYLADYFKQFNKPLSIIPTPVDTSRFTPKPVSTEQLFLGWSGSSSGFKYLYEIESGLIDALSACPDWKLLIIADVKPRFKQLPDEKVVFIKWSPEVEVSAIQRMSIGLMPLQDDPWSNGKCSYKMLLYMACAIPCVVSNVGMNKDILQQAEVGIGVENIADWGAELTGLMNNYELRQRLGCAGRYLTEEKYSLDSASSCWFDIFASMTSVTGAPS